MPLASTESAISSANDQSLAAAIAGFARLLRRAGLPVGTGAVLDAQRAVALVGIERRDDFRTCLYSRFVSRAEQRPVFDQAFRLFWGNVDLLNSLNQGLATATDIDTQAADEALSRRLAEALGLHTDSDLAQRRSLELDIGPSASDLEQLAEKDFEAMSTDELSLAKTMLERLQLPLPELRSRRFAEASSRGQMDGRATLRASLRHSQTIPLRYRRPRQRQATLVVLCDISGSMAGYSRMLLHFMHSVLNARHDGHAFVFATQLTNITRQLRQRDVDHALASAASQVSDWSGGTRIRACLRQFNRRWSRRVLAQGAVVLLITDGLEQKADAGLAREMERLRKSSKRLIWLNPLLRWEQFRPQASGIQTMLPFVDEFRAGHNIRSLVELADLLSRQRPAGQERA